MNPQIDLLTPIHRNQEAKYPATCEALRGHLKSVARMREDGIVTSDDAVRYLELHDFGGDTRLIGAVLRAPHFVQCGFAKSTRRRGHHALWRVA